MINMKMNMKRIGVLVLIAVLAVPALTMAQEKNRDKGIFVEPKNPFWEEISKSLSEFGKKPGAPRQAFVVDLTGFAAPTGLEGFHAVWHNPPVSQGSTSTCWCYSTTSMFESEVYRLTGKKARISQAYTVYCEYLERTKRFIRERGMSAVAEGSEANAVTRDWKIYGCVPLEVYSGLQPGQKFPDHGMMFREISSYLKGIKTSNAWNEEEALATVKSILDHYLGAPPAKFTVEGREYTPLAYLRDYLKINPDDYVDVVSYMQQPFGRKVEYEVPDNWWHSKDYYNVPLETFMKILDNAVKLGISVSIGGDVSEPGKSNDRKVWMVPSFDIPSAYIDDNARQFRFGNETTTDDHGIHLIGAADGPGGRWYLIKDSGSGSFAMDPKGYAFVSRDYVRLKIMDFMVHKDAVKGFIDLTD